jgi:hypothetical protein
MAMKLPYTRRDIPKMQPDIRRNYRKLIMANNLSAYENYLNQYPTISPEEKQELILDFKNDAELFLRRRWRVAISS